MKLGELLALYLVMGVACAVAILVRAEERGGRTLGSAALAVPLWPLWAPVALAARRTPLPPGTTADIAQRIRLCLAEALDAVHGSPLQALLPRGAAERILSQVERAAARCAELDDLLAQPQLSAAAAACRIAALEQTGGTPRTLASARLHQENVHRLQDLRDRDRRALEELGELVVALRTQLVLARYAGSSAAGVGDVVVEMWARIEGLGAVTEQAENRA